MITKKLYTIKDIKPIPCLGNIVGPIKTPVRLSESDVLSLVKAGFNVYEHNPLKKKESVKVTLHNYRSIVFETSTKDAIIENRVKKELIKENNSSDKKDKKKKEETSKDDAVKEIPISMDFSK